MALFQAVVIGLLALIITPGYLFYFDVTPKVVVLLGGCAIALVGSGVRSYGGRLRWFSILLGLNVVSLAISTALSQQPALAAFGTNWRRFGFLMQAAVLLFAWLIASHTAGRPDRVRVILRAIAAAGGISALYGIAQYFGWDPILPAAGYHVGEGIWAIVRPPGTMGYVSYFATWLLFVTFLSMALGVMESRLRWRRLALGIAGIAEAATLLTGTRAAILGLVAGLAARWYFRARANASPAARAPSPVGRPPMSTAAPPVSRRTEADPRNGGRESPGAGISAGPAGTSARVTRLYLLGALVGVFTVGFYLSPLGLQLRSRARWVAEDASGGNRPALWRDSLRMALPRLPQGYGPEMYTAAFPRFESKALAESYPDFLHESPHNIFLDALIAQGLPGLLILCGLCYVGLRAPAGQDRGHWIRAALVAGIVSQCFTVFTLPTAAIFYVTIALRVGLTSEAAEPRRDWRFTLAASPIALALLYLAARFTISDHALALARRSVESGDLPAAVAHYDRYRRWNLPGTSADLWYSRALLALAQKTPDFTRRFQTIAQSGAAALRATQTAEDPFNAWYNMAVLYASQNDFVRTESSLRAAIAANPNWFKPHWTLAQLLRLEHRSEEAEREAVLAAELDAGKNPEVAQTLAEIRAQPAIPAPSQHKSPSQHK